MTPSRRYASFGWTAVLVRFLGGACRQEILKENI
jgi:hypothetical protein